jgi:hypothetical protein
MNSGVSNCIEVCKFWEYSTDLRMNISDRDRIFFEKFLSISFRIRIVSNRTTSISVEVYKYPRYLGVTTLIWFAVVIWLELLTACCQPNIFGVAILAESESITQPIIITWNRSQNCLIHSRDDFLNDVPVNFGAHFPDFPVLHRSELFLGQKFGRISNRFRRRRQRRKFAGGRRPKLGFNLTTTNR